MGHLQTKLWLKWLKIKISTTIKLFMLLFLPHAPSGQDALLQHVFLANVQSNHTGVLWLNISKTALQILYKKLHPIQGEPNKIVHIYITRNNQITCPHSVLWNQSVREVYPTFCSCPPSPSHPPCLTASMKLTQTMIVTVEVSSH